MTLFQDLKYAARALAKSPAFTAVAIVTIALAIGANTAMFSLVRGTLLNPVPYPDADRIVRLTESFEDGRTGNVSTLNYLDWVEQSTAFEHIAAEAFWGATLTGVDEPVQLPAVRVAVQYFQVTGTSPTLGRLFRPDEDEPGSDNVVLMSHRLWRTRFGSDPTVVGRELVLNGAPHLVIGILPAGSFDRTLPQLFKPLSFAPAERTREFHWFDVVAKLRPGVSLDDARAEMDVIGRRLAAEYPQANDGRSVAVDRLADTIVGADLRTAVTVLFAATAFVLLIGCANLASLTLARGMSRVREIGVRASLGAGRWRIARQILTENAVLSICGGVLGIALGYLAVESLHLFLPQLPLPPEIGLSVDAPVILFGLTVAVVTGLIFGLAPALQASRTNLVDAMRTGGHGSTTGMTARRIRSVLVVAEVSLAFVLLVGAGLLMRSFFSLLDADPGFDSTNVLTARMPVTHGPEPGALEAYLDSIRASVEAVPGVSQTAVTSAPPLQGWGYGMPYRVAGGDLTERGNRPWGFFKMVSPSYFGTLGIRLADGRALSDDDRAGSPRAMVINQTLARLAFSGANPIGRQMIVEEIIPGQPALGPEREWEIVGVIEDENVDGLAVDMSPGMYVPVAQSPTYQMSLIVRAAVEPTTLQSAIRRAVDEVNRDQVLGTMRPLEQLEVESLGSNRLHSTLLGLFASIALLLAALGIYGTISYNAAQRSHEMGIRSALGASVGNIQGLIFYGGMRLTMLGLVIGLLGALSLSRLMGSLLHGVAPHDPVTLLGVATLLALVAAAACFVPAQRASRTDPNMALRSE